MIRIPAIEPEGSCPTALRRAAVCDDLNPVAVARCGDSGPRDCTGGTAEHAAATTRAMTNRMHGYGYGGTSYLSAAITRA